MLQRLRRWWRLRRDSHHPDPDIRIRAKIARDPASWNKLLADTQKALTEDPHAAMTAEERADWANRR